MRSTQIQPKRMQLRPQFAEVFQFQGWTNAQQIFRWCKKVFYVGRGYEHELRRENEYDRGNHHILDDAPEFLALETEDEGWVRVDVGEYVVLGGSDGQDLGKMTQKELERFYVEPEV